MKKWFLVSVVLALFFSAFLGASETTLKAYIAQAAKDNAGVRAAYENWQAALCRVAYSHSLPEPKLTYGHFIESVETRVGPQKFKVGLAQMVPWFGKLASRKDVACQKALQAEKELEQAYTVLTLKLTEAFLEFFYLQKSIILQKDYIDLARAIEQTALSQAKVGGSGADVLQAQMELNRLQYELDTLQDNKVASAARICALLNIPVEGEMSLPIDIEDFLVPLQEGSVFRRTQEELELLNPQIKIIESQRKVQKSKKRLVRQNRFPDFTIGADWVKTDHAIMPTPDSGKDPVSVFVSLDFSIWLGTYRSQEKEADAEIRKISAAYQQHLFYLQAEQEKILSSYSGAKRRVELLQNLLLPEAEQSLSILTDAYKTGRADFERLQNAQITLLKLQLNLERARADLGIAVARYQAFIGES